MCAAVLVGQHFDLTTQVVRKVDKPYKRIKNGQIRSAPFNEVEATPSPPV